MNFNILNYLSRENLELTLLGALLFGGGAYLHNLNKQKKYYQNEIKFVEISKIFPMSQFLNSQKNRIDNTSHSQQQQYAKDFLIKTIPNSNQITIKRIIHSNQLLLCPPSVNPLIRDYIRFHNEDSPQQMKLVRDLFDRKQSISVGKVLVDKFQAQTKYYSRSDLAQVHNKNLNIIYQRANKNNAQKINFENYRDAFGQLDEDLQLSFFEKLRQKLGFYCQRFGQFFMIYKNRRRSKNEERKPLIKGILSGVLQVNYNFLRDTYFLLKVRIQGKNITTQLIGDNKIALINYYKDKVFGVNMKIGLCSLVIIGYSIYQMRKFYHKLKILWLRRRVFNDYHIDPSGIDEDKLCQICYTNCRNVLFYGCKHMLMCDLCFLHHPEHNCILCNANIDKMQIVYGQSIRRR